MSRDLDHTAHRIAIEVDEPVPILFWSVQDIIWMVMGFGMGVLVNSIMLGLVLAVLFLKVGARLRRGAKRGATLHALHSLGLALDAILKQRFPPPTVNEFYR